MSLSNHYFMMASCNVNGGHTLYFWRDSWNPGVLRWRFPQLFSFALNKDISLKAFLSKDINSLFWQPISEEASE
jgi:hypothetical protein